MKQKLRLKRNKKPLKKLSVKQLELRKVRVGKPKKKRKKLLKKPLKMPTMKVKDLS